MAETNVYSAPDAELAVDVVAGDYEGIRRLPYFGYSMGVQVLFYLGLFLVGESGSLYASVSTKEVAAAIKEQLKADIPTKNMKMDDHIKSVGEYVITLKLHKEVSASLTLNVSAE